MLEVCQQIVRWEASYKARPFPKKLKKIAGAHFFKMSKVTWGGPRAPPTKITKSFGPGPKFGPMGPL